MRTYEIGPQVLGIRERVIRIIAEAIFCAAIFDLLWRCCLHHWLGGWRLVLLGSAGLVASLSFRGLRPGRQR
jgi:hypothetical protein